MLHAVSHPAPVKVGSFRAGSADWSLAREYRIGGSEIAAIMGLSPFASRFSTFARKLGLGSDTRDPEAEWGTRMEPLVWQRFTEGLEDIDWLTWLYAPGSYVHGERDWQLATPDGWLMNDGQLWELVEVKCPVTADMWGQPGTDQIPVYYRAQAIWNLSVFGLTTCWVPVKIGHSDYREYKITWDDEAEEDLAIMLEHGAQFIDDLKAANWPDPADGSAATYEILREMHPDIEKGLKIEISPELAGDFLAAKLEYDRVEAEWNAARSRMAEAMGKAQHAELQGERVAYRSARRNREGVLGNPSVQADQANLKRLKVGQTIKEALCRQDS